MKVILALLILLTSELSAHWPVLKPTEFEPLTSLPWERKDATLETVLGAIFREPNPAIRYRILGEYLRRIPSEEMGKAFEICVPLEGTQNPNELVARFIPVWAERDSAACWEWVKRLFGVVGIENGVLGYDSWSHPKITVQNLGAIRASPFWIERDALQSFPVFLGRSKLPKAEQVRMMKEFADKWFSAFSSWPGYLPGQSAGSCFEPMDSGEQRAMITILSAPITWETLSMVLTWNDRSSAVTDLVHEIAFRRMLQANPASAPEIVRKARERKPSGDNTERSRSEQPSNELLLVWAKSDLAGMIRWVDSLDAENKDLATRVKGLLMSLADAETRQRWLTAANAEDPKEERAAALLESWAAWDLEGALAAAANAENPEATRSLANSAVYGPWFGQPWNQSRYAFRILSTYDFSKLPPEIHNWVFEDCYSLMEQWNSMDVASAARFGYAFLLRTGYAPREGLIQFFSGKDIYGGEDGMIDRTFCALRVWAVVRPDEMKEWISTLKDAEMRTALTWLLENPWGTGEEE